MSTGLVYHPDCLKHIPYPGNPEVPERVSKTMDYFRESGLLDELMVLTPEPASDEDIARVHQPEHMEYVRTVSETGYGEDEAVNTDVYICADTFHAAHLAAGGVIKAAESVCTSEVGNCFALVRPPGHHANPAYPAGFCYFNNTAVAIRSIQEKLGVERVAVFDWDAHAGNGTMNVFYEDPSVLTISAHQDPHYFYPGTGFVEQTGEGEGHGYCINLPVPAGTGNADYMHLLDDFVLDKIKEFNPGIIFVAAGQDSHVSDMISGLELTDDGYVAMSLKLMELASEVCGGKLVLVLEGGYNLETLPTTHHAIVSALAGKKEIPDIEGEVLPSTLEVLEHVRDALDKDDTATAIS